MYGTGYIMLMNNIFTADLYKVSIGLITVDADGHSVKNESYFPISRDNESVESVFILAEIEMAYVQDYHFAAVAFAHYPNKDGDASSRLWGDPEPD